MNFSKYDKLIVRGGLYFFLKNDLIFIYLGDPRESKEAEFITSYHKTYNDAMIAGLKAMAE
jgi:hypothetical protein